LGILDSITLLTSHAFIFPFIYSAIPFLRNLNTGGSSPVIATEYPSLLLLAIVVLSTSAVVFENTRLDARLAHNPFVKGDPGLLFYAAAPLVGTGQ
jgi:hypothetical protein